MSDSQPTHHDAELVLKLYDLRREPLMREARAYFAGLPANLDTFLAVSTNPSTKENSYIRQVCGYWEMVAALVIHGTLNAALVHDTCQEMHFVYAKIEPFLSDIREKAGMPDFLQNVQKAVEASPKARERVARLQSRFAAMAAAPAQTAN